MLNFFIELFTDRAALFLTVIVSTHITFVTIQSFIGWQKERRKMKLFQKEMMESEKRFRTVVKNMELARKDLLQNLTHQLNQFDQNQNKKDLD